MLRNTEGNLQVVTGMQAKWLGAIALGMAALLTFGDARAEPLDEAACKQLKDEQTKLIGQGLRTDMERGPEWAKANLPAAKLDQIKHLIEIEEQLSFRCPIAAKPAPQQAKIGAESETDSKAVTPAEAAAKAKKKAKAKPKKQPEQQQDFFDGFALPDFGDTPVEAKPEQKVKKKVKKAPVNDAYVPPPPSNNAFVDGEPGPVPQAPPAQTP